MNAMPYEIANVILAAGLTLNADGATDEANTEWKQLMEAIADLDSSYNLKEVSLDLVQFSPTCDDNEVNFTALYAKSCLRRVCHLYIPFITFPDLQTPDATLHIVGPGGSVADPQLPAEIVPAQLFRDFIWAVDDVGGANTFRVCQLSGETGLARFDIRPNPLDGSTDFNGPEVSISGKLVTYLVAT
jgi:hypothetical protein